MIKQRSVVQGMSAKTAVFAIKLCVAVLLLFFLWRAGLLDPSALEFITLDTFTVTLVTLAVTSVFCGQLLITLRLWLLLLHEGAQVSYFRVLGVTLVGSLSGSLLPGLVGGDAVKMLYLFGDLPRKSHVVAVVMIDRVIGLYSLIMSSAISVILVATTTSSKGQMPTFFFSVPLSLALIATIVLLGASWGGWSSIGILNRIYEVFPSKVRTLTSSLRECLPHPRLLLVLISLSLANHALVIVTFVVAGWLMHVGIPSVFYFIMSPLAMVMNIIPLTPGGVGITESAFSMVFSLVGSTHGAMVGLFGRSIQYLAFAFGGAIAVLVVRFQKN